MTGVVPERSPYGGYGFDAESGLYHTDAREYHGSLGRFVQVDPIGTAGGLERVDDPDTTERRPGGPARTGGNFLCRTLTPLGRLHARGNTLVLELAL
ncbi:MAG: hypothetical protein NTX87_20270 [Planctomycetota bacterium]|nr:hypothetical protein [Planctomycetota bacterium]